MVWILFSAYYMDYLLILTTSHDSCYSHISYLGKEMSLPKATQFVAKLGFEPRWEAGCLAIIRYPQRGQANRHLNMHPHTYAHVCMCSHIVPTCMTLLLALSIYDSVVVILSLRDCRLVFLRCMFCPYASQRHSWQGGEGSDPESPKLLNFPK